MLHEILVALIVIAILGGLWILLKILKLVNEYLNTYYIRTRNYIYSFVYKYRSLCIISLIIIVISLLIIAINYDKIHKTDLGSWFAGIVALLIALSNMWHIPPLLRIVKMWGTTNTTCGIQIINMTKFQDFVELRHVYLSNHCNSNYNKKLDCQVLIPSYISKYAIYTHISSYGSIFIPIMFPTGSNNKIKIEEERFVKGFLKSKYKYLKFTFTDTYRIGIPTICFSRAQIKHKRKDIKDLVNNHK